MDDEGWDLHAVVRGYAAAPANNASAATDPSTNTDPFPNFTPMPFHQSSFDDFKGGIVVDDNSTNPLFKGFQDVYQELCGDYPQSSAAAGGDNISTTAAQVFQLHHATSTVHQTNMQFKNQGFGFPHTCPNSNPQPLIRPRRRKNQQLKMVRQMTQEELSADSWAWRKYGQKPIKGSPYPRNYYRCSTSKGCAARKQVERSPENSETFIVSYTGEHSHPKPSHRSSLAGSTRNKFETKPSNNNDMMLLHQKGSSASIVYSSSSPPSSSSFSPCPPLVEGEAFKENVEDIDKLDDNSGEDEDDNDFGLMIKNNNIDDDDDFSKGFEDSDDHDGLGGGGGNCGDHLFSGGSWK